MWDTEGARAALEALPAEAPPQLHATRDELLASACFVDGDKRAAGARFERLALKGQAASYNLGLIAFEAGRYEEALALFERASQNADPHYYTLLYRAWCLLELNRFDEGRNVLEEIIRMAGTPESYQLLGRLELRAGGHARAEAAFRKATTLAPALAEARFGLATALRHLGRSEESRETFARFRALHEAEQAALRRAYELNQDQLARPEDPRAALRLAELYLETGDATGAERVAWTALRLEPEGVEARLCLARALSRQARFREALLHYRRILTEHAGHALARAAETELRAMIDRHGRAR
jgi:tetratricopeptide (TPR) repeat protein